MAVGAHHPRLSSEEFGQLVEGAALGFELIRGEPVVMLPDGLPASSVQLRLAHQLLGWQERTGDAGLLLTDVFVELDASTTLGPDVVWWQAARRPPIRPGRARIVPDWVAEVLSDSTRGNDLGPKRELYLASGVRELWLVDPAARTVTVVAADGGEAVVTAGGCASRVLDGFSVALASLFATD